MGTSNVYCRLNDGRVAIQEHMYDYVTFSQYFLRYPNPSSIWVVWLKLLYATDTMKVYKEPPVDFPLMAYTILMSWLIPYVLHISLDADCFIAIVIVNNYQMMKSNNQLS